MKFITGNSNKFREAKKIIPELERKDLDLEEIQELDPQKIIEHKLSQVKEENIVVEDISLFDRDGFPGPLIKWMLKALSLERIADILKGPATAQCTLGVRLNNEVFYIKAEISGTIVPPRGAGFGFDPIFLPDGTKKTFGEEKKDSMRTRAFRKLKARMESVSLVFGCFDCLHEGHRYYFREAAKYGTVVAIVARDETIRKLKGEPHFSEQERLRHVLKEVPFAELGSRTDKYQAIREYRPAAICLGHDQHNFTEGIEQVLKEENIDSKIIRIEPYKRDIYRSSLLKRFFKC
ncbi:MAG: non-canonical purine NTP pyrophosphatase [Candidatus Woesearchaeota archaeon]